MSQHLYDGDEQDCETCWHCEDGVMLVCMDDLCRGSDQCFFEKPNCGGIVICPHCNGSGVLPA